MDEINKKKVEIFDLIEQINQLNTQANILGQLKMQKMNELSALKKYEEQNKVVMTNDE
jgi:hypothetical protein